MEDATLELMAVERKREPSWQPVIDSSPEIILVTSFWKEMLWFYRSFLGARQLTPFVEEGGRPVYVRLELFSLVLGLTDKEYAEKNFPELDFEGKGNRLVMYLKVSGEDLQSLHDLAATYEVSDLCKEIEPEETGVFGASLRVMDLEGNLLYLSSS